MAEKTTVVNLFAGPGAGKTTGALEISAELKKRGVNLEYVQEYAKELVYAEKYDLLKDQEHVTDTQYERLNTLRGKVDVIVTDSPVLLGMIYGKGRITPEYEQKLRDYHNSFNNFNLFIERGTGYQQEGRLESRAEAEEKDREIKSLLDKEKVYYGVYNHDTLKKVVDDVLSVINKEKNTENKASQQTNKTNQWRKVLVPADWCVKRYDKVSFYRLGKQAGEYAGYSFSHPNSLVGANESADVKYGSPAEQKNDVKCERLVFRADSLVTLKKGSDEKKVTGKQLVQALSHCLEAYTQVNIESEKPHKEKSAKEEKRALKSDIEPLKAIPQDTLNVLNDSFEEDIFDYDEKQVLKASQSDKYIIASNDELVWNENGELILSDNAKDMLARSSLQGEKIIFASQDEAISELVGGSSKTYDKLSEEDKEEVNKAYLALLGETDEEYYDSLPSREAFAKDFLIKKNWAKYQNYKNDKAYEKNTPYVLRDKKCFVCWKFVYYNEKGEPYSKPQKVPFSPHYDGMALSSSQNGSHFKTWGTFEEACKAVDKFGYDGIGIMFGNGIMGIDIDGCIKNGEITEQAKDIISRVNSYTEYSPSGTGVHTLCFGTIPKGSRNDAIGLEMYPSGRFFTLTGHRYENYSKMAKKADSQPVIDEIYNTNFANKPSNIAITNPVGAPTEATYTSQEIVDKLLHSPKMADKFRRLCQGLPPREYDAVAEKWKESVDKNFLREDGSADMSKLDYAFCKMLIFYRATAEQIDEIYRAQNSSAPKEGLTVDGGGLARDKWDRRQGATTYGQYVINNAYAGVTALYNPDTAKDYARGFAERKKARDNQNQME